MRLPLPALLLGLVAHARDYQFDGKISRPVLENYLSRSITMLDLLTGHGDVDDNIRMLKSTGAKFVGRTIYLWGHEGQLPKRLAAARQNTPKVHKQHVERFLQTMPKYQTWTKEYVGIAPVLTEEHRAVLTNHGVIPQDLNDLTHDLG